ncbi:MAG: hypothetical protein ACKOSS_05975 [Planctomycetia bacterium]
MPSPMARPRPWRGPRGARARALARGAGLLGLLLGVLLLGAPAPALARSDEGVEQLRERLLRARTQGEREGALKLILARPAEQVGATLGPLFSRTELGASPELLVAAAKQLAESPVTGAGSGRLAVVLLADAIFQRAAADGAFVAQLRDALAVDPLTEQAPGWERLLDNALATLEARSGRTAAERMAALRFLACEEGPRAGRVVDDLERHARRLRGEPAGAERDAELGVLLEAVERLLVYRFGSLDVALPELERTRGWSTLRRLRHFSGLKTAADRDRSLAVLHGVSAIRAMGSPAELASVFEGTSFPYPEHHAAALERAARLQPVPTPAWEAFYAAVLARTPEGSVVEAALDQLGERGFGGSPAACCRLVADALQRRLVDAAFRDGPALRQRLVTLLGDLGATEQVRRQVVAVLERGTLAAEDVDEVVELVRAVGRSPGLEVKAWLKPFYDLTQLALPEGVQARERLRTAVAGALGREGVRASDPQAAIEALDGILEGGALWERATQPRVRMQAFRSLAAYPEDGVVRGLLRTALAPGVDGDTEALLAIESLGQMLLSGEEGARRGAAALAALLEQSAAQRDGALRRVEALKRLRGLVAAPALGEGLLEAVRAAVRAGLEPGGDAALRIEAGRTAVALADAEALPRLVAWWGERGQPAAQDLLPGLLEAVVRTGPAGDARVAEALASVAALPGGADPAVAWAARAAGSAARGPRPVLVRAQARSLVARAAARAGEPGGRDAALQDLAAARTLLASVLGGPYGPAEVEAARRELLGTLEAQAGTLGEGPLAADRLLEGVLLAARATDRLAWQQGDRMGRRLLSSPGLRQHLGPEREADLARLLGLLAEALRRQE